MGTAAATPLRSLALLRRHPGGLPMPGAIPLFSVANQTLNWKKSSTQFPVYFTAKTDGRQPKLITREKDFRLTGDKHYPYWKV